ncbi:MAG: hypothetical protein WD048_05700 [Chitinophagales bacterium]
MLIKGNLSSSELLWLETKLEYLLLPWKIDLSTLHQIDNPDLLKHIDQVGKEFYNREKQAVLKEPKAPYSNNSKPSKS